METDRDTPSETSENISSQFLPYRSQNFLENNAPDLSSGATTTRSSDQSDNPVLSRRPHERSDNVDEYEGVQQNTFLQLTQQLLYSCVPLGIALDCSLEIFGPGFDTYTLDFIGQGKTFYTSRVGLRPGVRLEIPAGGGPKKLIVNSEMIDHFGNGDIPAEIGRHSREVVVVSKLPLVEFTHHGKPKDDGNNIRLKAVILEVQVLTHKPLYEHENIVDFLGVSWAHEIGRTKILVDDDDSACHDPPITMVPVLLIEYADYGTLTDFMSEDLYAEQLSFKEKQSLCRDIVEGLFALHSCGIVHGDIKPDNILIFKGRNMGYTAKLNDFGFSVTQEASLQTGGQNKHNSMWKLTGRTWPWNDPECNLPRTWDELTKTDVFSYGLLAWTILHGAPIWKLFDLTSDDDGRLISPKIRDMVEHLKKDGTLGKKAATYFRAFDQPIQLFVTCLFESCLNPTVDLRGTSGDICRIWDIWFNESHPREKSKFLPIEVDPEKQRLWMISLPMILNHAWMMPAQVFDLLITPTSTNITGKPTRRSEGTLMVYRSLCHVIGRGVERDLHKAAQLMRQATNILPEYAPLQAMFLAEGGVNGDLDHDIADVSYTSDTLRKLMRIQQGYNSEEITRQIYRYFSNPDEPIDLYQLRCTHWIMIESLLCGINGSPHWSRLEGTTAKNGFRFDGNILHTLVSMGLFNALDKVLQSPNLDPRWLEGRNAAGDTPFLIACRLGGYCPAVSLLVAGSKLETTNNAGETMLHLLCNFEDPTEVADFVLVLSKVEPSFISLAIDADAIYCGSYDESGMAEYQGGTPLIRAVLRNKIDVVRVLLQLGAGYTVKDRLKRTPVQLAAKLHCIDILDLFANHDPYDTVWQEMELLNATVLNSYGFQRLYFHGLGYTANMRKTIDFLLDRIAKRPVITHPNQAVQYALSSQDWRLFLQSTVSKADEDVLEYLLSRIRIDQIPDNDHRYLLNEAIKAGSFSKFKLLLDHNANPHAPAHFPPLLDCCILNGTIEMVQELLRHKVDLCDGPEFKFTALAHAVISGNFNIARLLLSEGADIDASDARGYTVIGSVVHLCSPKSIPLLRFLLDGALPGKRTHPSPMTCPKYGQNVFHALALIPMLVAQYDWRAMLDIFDLLRDRFPDPQAEFVNAVDGRAKSTPLEIAIVANNEPLVRRLLEIPGIRMETQHESNPKTKTVLELAFNSLRTPIPPKVTKLGQRAVNRYCQDRKKILSLLAGTVDMEAMHKAAKAAGFELERMNK